MQFRALTFMPLGLIWESANSLCMGYEIKLALAKIFLSCY